MAFDVQQMTLGEVEEFERRAKMSITAMGDTATVKGTPLRALALIAMRRDDPAAKWEDTADLTMADATALIQPAQDADPN